MRLLICYIRRFKNIPIEEKKLLFKAMIYILYFSLIINLLPLKYYLSYLNSINYHVNSDINKLIYFNKIRKTANRAMKFLPLKCSCLVNSLTYKYLLKDLGISSNIEIEIFRNACHELNMHAYIVHDNKPLYYFVKNSGSNIRFPINMK